MCKVSVIVPTYNVEMYLRECMDSIVEQSLRDLEIICVNDGSTDRSGDILREYAVKDRRIRIIDQKNAGYGRAVNVGIQEARGEYVAIVEPDDYIENEMFEKLYAAASRHSLDFVKADCAFFKGDAEARVFDRVMICPKISWYGRILHPCKMPWLLDAEMMNVTGIYRRKFLLDKRIVLRETPGALYQDTGMWFQIFINAESCMFIPRKFYNIRRDNPGSSMMQTEKFSAICEEYADNYARLQQDRELCVRFAPYLFKRKVCIYMFILSKVDTAGQVEMTRRFSEELRVAIEKQEYRPHMFTQSIQRFLRDVSEWTGEGMLPAYTRSRSAFIRFGECIVEHGCFYTTKRMLIKAKLRQDISSGNIDILEIN